MAEGLAYDYAVAGRITLAYDDDIFPIEVVGAAIRQMLLEQCWFHARIIPFVGLAVDEGALELVKSVNDRILGRVLRACGEDDLVKDPGLLLPTDVQLPLGRRLIRTHRLDDGIEDDLIIDPEMPGIRLVVRRQIRRCGVQGGVFHSDPSAHDPRVTRR